MPMLPPLSPTLQRFIHDQIASGRFQSEEQLIRAALHLFASRQLRTDSHTTLATPRSNEAFRSGSRDQGQPGVSATFQPNLRRSPRGLLADLHNDVSPEDFEEARGEVWLQLGSREAE